MVRISWPLAVVLVGIVALLARRPRLISWVLLALAIWFVVETLRARKRR